VKPLQLTDEQCERIKGLLPGKAGDPDCPAQDNRRFVNAVYCVLKTGIPRPRKWADLPERLGKPNTVWKRHGRWWVATRRRPRRCSKACGPVM